MEDSKQLPRELIDTGMDLMHTVGVIIDYTVTQTNVTLVGVILELMPLLEHT